MDIILEFRGNFSLKLIEVYKEMQFVILEVFQKRWFRVSERTNLIIGDDTGWQDWGAGGECRHGRHGYRATHPRQAMDHGRFAVLVAT